VPTGLNLAGVYDLTGLADGVNARGNAVAERITGDALTDMEDPLTKLAALLC